MLPTESSPEEFGLPNDHPKMDHSLQADDGVLHAKSPPKGSGLFSSHPKEDHSLQDSGGVIHAKTPPKQSGLSGSHPKDDHSIQTNGGVLHAKTPPKQSGIFPRHPNGDHSLQGNGGVPNAKSPPKQSGLSPSHPNSLKGNGNLPFNHDIDPTIMQIAKFLQAWKNSGALLYLSIGVLIFLLLLFPGLAICFAVRYFRLKRKNKNPFSVMEDSSGMAEDDNVENHSDDNDDLTAVVVQ